MSSTDTNETNKTFETAETNETVETLDTVDTKETAETNEASNAKNSVVSSFDEDVSSYTRRYMDFIDASPTSFHAARNGAQILSDAGFQEVDLREQFPAAPGAYYTVKGGALVAWILPDGSGASGFALVGSHTDSPALKLKPVPQRTTSDGWGQLLVEVYGGPLFNSWLDRELSLAGVVLDKSGARHLVHTQPIARIPQLAPHLDRTQNRDGVVLDAQQHLQPVWMVGREENVLDLVAQNAGLQDADQILSYQLFLVPTQEAALFGTQDEFLAASRQDNLSSAYGGLEALIAAQKAHLTEGAGRWPTDQIPVYVSFDHEEVGSASATGARSDLLPSILRRLTKALKKDEYEGEESYGQMLAGTTLISADAGHSVHPNYADKLDPDTRPVMGQGPILKVDADQRYATSVESIGLWNAVCEAQGVSNQSYVTKSSMASGSTIGPALSTMLGVVTADVGIAMLSMHSTREMSHVVDNYLLSQAMYGYWTKPLGWSV